MWTAYDNRKPSGPPRTVARPVPAARLRPGTGASGRVRRALGKETIAQLEDLCAGSGIAVGVGAVVLDLAAIGVTAVASALVHNIVMTIAAVLYIGVRQRHLSNLAHECVHSKITRSSAVNRALGYFLTAILGEGFVPYRISHQVHHGKLGQQGDPMLESYLSRNVCASTPHRISFIWHVIVVKALWTLPKAGIRTFFSKAPDESRSSAVGRAAFWIAITVSCLSAGMLISLAIYWLIPVLFIRPTVTWITDLGNHAGVIESGDPITQTRGWTSHWLTRHLLGGHLDDMYHPIHHWCPRIPWRHLPRAKQILQVEFDRWQEVPWCSGYFLRRRSTPGTPCVIEDIITCLLENAQATPTA